MIFLYIPIFYFSLVPLPKSMFVGYQLAVLGSSEVVFPSLDLVHLETTVDFRVVTVVSFHYLHI